MKQRLYFHCAQSSGHCTHLLAVRSSIAARVFTRAAAPSWPTCGLILAKLGLGPLCQHSCTSRQAGGGGGSNSSGKGAQLAARLPGSLCHTALQFQIYSHSNLQWNCHQVKPWDQQRLEWSCKKINWWPGLPGGPWRPGLPGACQKAANWFQ